MISAQDIEHSYGERNLFDKISFTILQGERVCLVGKNGSGKSTLMGLVAQGEAQHGEINKSPKLRMGFLQQEPDLDPTASVIAAMRQSMIEHGQNIALHKNLCAQLAGTTDELKLNRLANEASELAHQIEIKGGFDLEHQIEKVLNRLNISAREQKIAELSGGEQRRVDLARVLLMSPDIYLLDEPTNHLDIDGIEFLVDVLRKNKSTVLFISHDRAFIDDMATRILELSHQKLFAHDPPFANYLERKLVRELAEKQSLHRSQRILVSELDWLRAGVKARTTKQNARIDRAYDLMEQVKNEEDQRKAKKLTLSASMAKKFGRTILEIKNVTAGFAGRTLFKDFSLVVTPGERFGILGPNGAGKTTLVSIIAKRKLPQSGEVKHSKSTEVVVFDQKRESLEEHKTLKETLCEQGEYVFINEQAIHIASYLERYLFDKRDARRLVATLSGGEKNRLLLAKLFLRSSNCLVLDEPTNDLDEESLAILEDLLTDYPGAIFVVSHDRAFLDRICTKMIVFEPGADPSTSDIVVYPGNYSTYKSLKAQAQLDAPSEQSPKKAKKIREKSKDPEKLTYKEELELDSLEPLIEAKEEELKKIHNEMAEADFFKKDSQSLAAINELAAKLEIEIEQLVDRWQELSLKKPR